MDWHEKSSGVSSEEENMDDIERSSGPVSVGEENSPKTPGVPSKLPQWKDGMAPIKKEFILMNYTPQIVSEFISKADQQQLNSRDKREVSDTEDKCDARAPDGEPPTKKMKKIKGRNKFRPISKKPVGKDKLCPLFLESEECSFGEKCRFSHDMKSFIASKPPDISDHCYLFEQFGKCVYSIACRFGGQHLTNDFKNIINEDLYAKTKQAVRVKNTLEKPTQTLLWKKKYNFTKADKAVREAHKAISSLASKRCGNKRSDEGQVSCSVDSQKHSVGQEDLKLQQISSDVVSQTNGGPLLGEMKNKQDLDVKDSGSTEQVICDLNLSNQNLPDVQPRCLGTVTDEDVIRVRWNEKKQVDFKDKLYLAPLTTVGNLPFRRICKRYGADITCSEMAMSTNLLQGQLSEWALLKRHATEDIFGVQLCGSFPDSMTRCAQLITEVADVNFVDINCGCPIDLVFKRGEGCAMMGRLTKFENIVKSMTSVLNCPLTVKLRTGIWDSKNLAHTLIPKLRDWGVSLVTVHGRSREQRYTKLADWNYINTCCKAGEPMPVYGNGDILSYEEAVMHQKETGVSGLMIARGALIKPWIFTEIKEQRHWDISANERFDMLKDFVNFGLEHWGSDQQGVESTRRFLLEWQSFLYRYIPVGVLEHLPQKINERPPYYIGRNDLETIMASPNCGDWIKLSEMLLGPVPSGFHFLPKHKANAYK